ncbi:zinc finger MYM-type protein 3-like [Ylistrum balloti]|uniref:zinc finger MYM-type protein 3-like n=1 Tax=Ylistrum balloti TaxID=509963 RepID=UPI002905BF68|nr:zinc finger MYM-type protein 3-like [Ylistrum balloti]
MEREPKTLDEILEESEPTTAAATNGKQFRKVNADDIDNFLKNQQNRDTKRKTEQDMSVFKAYLIQCGEGRQPEVIPPSELDTNISMFLLFVKRKGGSDYEPTTLRSYVGSLDRYLKENNYPVGLMCDLQFKKCRAVLKTKQKQLKGTGKGNMPRAADELTDMELEQLCETNTLGMQSPAALLYSVWMICTMHFGMRPGKETHDLKWGDVEQKTDVENGEEYIVNIQKRQTKTRTGSCYC